MRPVVAPAVLTVQTHTHTHALARSTQPGVGRGLPLCSVSNWYHLNLLPGPCRGNLSLGEVWGGGLAWAPPADLKTLLGNRACGQGRS